MLKSKAMATAFVVALSLVGGSASFAAEHHFNGGNGGQRHFNFNGGGRSWSGHQNFAKPNFNAGASVQHFNTAPQRFTATTNVRPGWNGGYYRHDRRGRFFGPGVGFAAGLAVGSAYAAAPYYYGSDPSYYDDGYYAPAPVSDAVINACMQQYGFVSYDPATNTYLGPDGVRYSCSL